MRQRLKGHPSHCCGGGATIDLPLAAAQQYLPGELGVYVDSVGSGEDAMAYQPRGKLRDIIAQALLRVTQLIPQKTKERLREFRVRFLDTVRFLLEQ